MTKQEEIRNRLIDFLDGLENPYTDADNRPRGQVEELLKILDSQGVVIKVDRELTASICGYCSSLDSCLEEHRECGKFSLCPEYVAVESLLETMLMPWQNKQDHAFNSKGESNANR